MRELGTSVAGAGDVNGDGFADVIVGAPHYDDGQAARARPSSSSARLRASATERRRPRPRSSSPTRTTRTSAASVATAGDVNGDGFADVIVGAPDYDDGQSDEGAAFVFLGCAAGVADGTPPTPTALLESDQAGRDFGAAWRRPAT